MNDSKAGPAQAGPARVIDLDQKRAARAEAKGEPVTVRFGDRDFTLPPELPVDFVELIRDGKLREGFSALLGEDAEAFFAAKPSIDDLNELSIEIGDAYGVNTGEAPASPNS